MNSEKEKMLAGRPCQAHDPELETDRLRARLLSHQYNHLVPGNAAQQQEILTKLLGTAGRPVHPELRIRGYELAFPATLGNPCKVLRETTEEDSTYYYKKLRFDES
jgi:hypothetical protein